MNDHAADVNETLDIDSSMIRGGTAAHGPTFEWSDIWKAPLHDLPIRDEILYQYLPLAPDMDVVEIGPGSGFTAFRLSRRVRRLTLLDIARGTIEKLNKSLAALPNLDFVCADPCDVAFPANIWGCFDAVYALDVFQYVPDSSKWLARVARFLKPGGVMMLAWPNYCAARTLGVNHVQTMTEMDRLLGDAGFESWQVYRLRLRPYARLLYSCFHEYPRKLYQRVRGHREALDAQIYDQTWSYQHGQKIEPLRYALHTAWTLFFAAVRLGGACFERSPVRGGSADGNLLVLARAPKSAAPWLR